jgi:hypothetical protein
VRRAWLCLLVIVGAGACAPEGCSACSDRDERRIEHWVDLVVREPGPTGDGAARALIEHGSGAIQYLETGLYDAEPAARRRIVKVLVGIEDPVAIPILEHLAGRDPDPDVRWEAERGLAAFGAPSPRRGPARSLRNWDP